MTITEGTPGKGLHIGNSFFSMKSSNNSCENDPCSISHAIKPSMVYAGRTDHLLLRSNRLYFMRCVSNRCPAIFAVGCVLVCCRFIDEYELFSCVVCQLTHPLIPQLWVTLCSTYLDLGIRKFKEIVIKKGGKVYLFF